MIASGCRRRPDREVWLTGGLTRAKAKTPALAGGGLEWVEDRSSGKTINNPRIEGLAAA